jgi:hypothetical protein
MLYRYLPLETLGIIENTKTTNDSLYHVIDEFRCSEFDQVILTLNKVWFLQILIAWLYCIKIRRFVPVQANAKNSIFIKQFYIYLFNNSLAYFVEVLFSNAFFILFERFAHHVISALLFYVSYLKPNIISVAYLTPFLLHSIYLLELSYQYTDEILFVYNLSILVCSAIMMYATYNRRIKFHSLRVLILSGLLFNVNLFGKNYGYYVNLFELDYKKAASSFMFSLALSSPFYFYLVHVNYEKWWGRTIFKFF